MRRPTLALLLGCLLLVAGASALDGYDYYQTIEYAACDQEIYQQDIIIHRTTGTAYNETAGGLETWHIYVGEHCQADYDDIRFTNSTGAELAYYLWPDYDAESARLTVRLEGADAAGSLFVWYGNPTATTTSDENNVFLLFDNFDGESLDTSIWTNSGNSGGVTIENGEAIIRASASSGVNHNRYITSANPLSDSVSVFIRAKYQTAGLYGLNIAVGRSARNHYGSPYIGASYYETLAGGLVRGWGQDSTNLGGSVAVTNYNVYRFDIYDSKADYWLNGNQIFSNRPISFSTFPYVELYVSTWDSGNTVRLYVDYVLVRTYSATPPAATTFSGEQETAAPPMTPIPTRPRATEPIDNVSTSLVDDLINSLGGETVPEPGNDTINWTGLISTIAGAYTSVLGPLAYTLIFSIPFLMMWITQRDMTLPGLVGALFGLFIIVRLPAEFHLVAVTFIAISIVAVVYSLVKERV